MVSGWTNPFEKICPSKWGSSSPNGDEDKERNHIFFKKNIYCFFLYILYVLSIWYWKNIIYILFLKPPTRKKCLKKLTFVFQGLKLHIIHPKRPNRLGNGTGKYLPTWYPTFHINQMGTGMIYMKKMSIRYIHIIYPLYFCVMGFSLLTPPSQPNLPPPQKKKDFWIAFKVLISAAKESTESLAVKGGFAEEKFAGDLRD